MPRPTDIATKATRESRSRGGQARAAKIKADREAARLRSLERAAGMLDSALDAMEASLVSADERLRFQAARTTLDRLLGRPGPEGQLGVTSEPVTIKMAFFPDPSVTLRLTRAEDREFRRLLRKLELDVGEPVDDRALDAMGAPRAKRAPRAKPKPTTRARRKTATPKPAAKAKVTAEEPRESEAAPPETSGPTSEETAEQRRREAKEERRRQHAGRSPGLSSGLIGKQW